MTSGPEHYSNAEQHAADAEYHILEHSDWDAARACAEIAQVHATLALAAGQQLAQPVTAELMVSGDRAELLKLRRIIAQHLARPTHDASLTWAHDQLQKALDDAGICLDPGVMDAQIAGHEPKESAVDRCEDCGRNRCQDCGQHYCCEPCPCERSHNCPCECRSYDRRMTNAD